jgi:hypothetical protein
MTEALGQLFHRHTSRRGVTFVALHRRAVIRYDAVVRCEEV